MGINVLKDEILYLYEEKLPYFVPDLFAVVIKIMQTFDFSSFFLFY